MDSDATPRTWTIASQILNSEQYTEEGEDPGLHRSFSSDCQLLWTQLRHSVKHILTL